MCKNHEKWTEFNVILFWKIKNKVDPEGQNKPTFC